MDKAVIVFSGFNQRAVIAFLRTLTKANVPFAIVAKSSTDTIFSTVYKENVIAIRTSVELILEDVLKCIKNIRLSFNYTSYIIAPSSENLNRFLLANKEKLAEYNCQIPLVDKILYDKISDKKEFSDICNSFGIHVPEEINDYRKAKMPFVAKPRKYQNDDGKIYSPFLIISEKQRKDFLNNCDPSDFYYQKYLNGQSFYLLYYISKEGKVFKYSQENLIQQSDGKSIVAAVSSDIHKLAQFDVYEKLLLSLGFNGLIMIEIRKTNDENYMIEANPRFWGPSQLFIDSGINLFIPFLIDYALIDEKFSINETDKVTKYFWFGGIIENVKNKKDLTYYSIDETRLTNQLPSWLESDVYRREDTNNIFCEELF